MQEELMQFVKEMLLSESFSTLVVAAISLVAYKANKVLESRRDYDKLIAGIKGVVLFVQKDLRDSEGIIRSTEASERVLDRYDKVIKKLGLNEQEVREIIDRSYEKLKKENPNAFDDKLLRG